MLRGHQLVIVPLILCGCLNFCSGFATRILYFPRNSNLVAQSSLKQSETPEQEPNMASNRDQKREEPSSFSSLGEYDPSDRLPSSRRKINVGDPQQRLQQEERSVTSILKELAAIQQQGPQKYCILGTRHCSFLHQQIIELL
jgi:hypothetical protein